MDFKFLMEFKRIRTPQELIERKDVLFELFNAYLERTKFSGTAEEMLKAYFKNLFFVDWFVFLFGNNQGFLRCHLMSNSSQKVLYVDDLYCPKGGLKLSEIIQGIAKTLGIDEIWGKAEEKVFRTYRKGLKNKDKVIAQPIVRILL